MDHKPTRRTFLKGLSVAAGAVPFGFRHPPVSIAEGSETAERRIRTSPMDTEAIIGPMVGEVSATGACLWLRADRKGPLMLRLMRTGSADRILMAEAGTDRDLCVQWDIDGLSPATTYRYAIERDGILVAGGDELRFKTAPKPGDPSSTSVIFASCADSTSSPVWTRMATVGCDLLVLLGDTPYLEGKKLKKVRACHRRFLVVPELASLLRHTPLVATFDDNDCGGVDADTEARTAARQAFVEHRAMRSFGEGGRGIYRSLRYGPIELFLIDTRSFAGERPSPVDPHRRTLLGQAQWQWLTSGLKASDAPFKVLASGRVWNEKKPGGGDDWTEFRHERDALFRFIGDERISGCVLVGGDIHVSKAFRHRTRRLAGYDLHQFIASPLHDRVNLRRDVDDPELLHGVATPRTFIQMLFDTTGDAAHLTATCLNAAGQTQFVVRLHERDLHA